MDVEDEAALRSRISTTDSDHDSSEVREVEVVIQRAEESRSQSS